MLARRFAAQREHYAYIESCTYGTGYMDLLRVKCVQGVCQALGIRQDRPRETVRTENMEVSYRQIKIFLKALPGLKNTFTLANKAYRVHMYLEAQEPGAMSVNETVLHRQLNYMLGDALIGDGNGNSIAAQASQMTRVRLKSEVEAFMTRRR